MTSILHMRNWGQERVNNFPKVTPWISGRAGILACPACLGVEPGYILMILHSLICLSTYSSKMGTFLAAIIFQKDTGETIHSELCPLNMLFDDDNDSDLLEVFTFLDLKSLANETWFLHPAKVFSLLVFQKGQTYFFKKFIKLIRQNLSQEMCRVRKLAQFLIDSDW